MVGAKGYRSIRITGFDEEGYMFEERTVKGAMDFLTPKHKYSDEVQYRFRFSDDKINKIS